MTDLLTTRQVQDILKVDRITIYRMLQDGRLKGIKVGSQWRFTQAEVDRILEGAGAQKSFLAESGPLFPTHCVQTIQNLLTGISQMCALVIDIHGDPVTEFSTPVSLTHLVMSTTEGMEAYHDAWQEFAREANAKNGKFICPAGLTAATAPIHDRGLLVGWFLVGQVFLDEKDKQQAVESAPEFAARYGLNGTQITDAFLEVPILESQQWKMVENWADQAAQAVSSILTERSGYKQRLQQIADLTQMW